GNYYLSQRYFSPKNNLMLSVYPMYEKYPGWSPYVYAMHRPTVLVDPTGMVAESPDDWVLGKDGYTWDPNVTSADDPDLNGREYIGKSINDVSAHYKEHNPISSLFFGEPKIGDTS